ncbi:MAG: hypothetical protein AVDCRST_MAG49-4707 [uncultured Thermomicrobiales bacterium]|uniref:Nudix hydrolase domain-containing protein n=1 Tax=uncultured Thermomicrobiales bacterium TaxID=1645740 RepID=A0A6J4VIX0_9BACT|nr:MAG: hypothetical protein AVDCRST_MAG49-4707 [uncultured Thermomicrobiales bacterium]
MAGGRYVVNVEAVIARRGRYLMTVRGDGEPHAAGTLSVPGGKVEGGADGDDVLEATLRREVAEEVGLTVGDELVYLESKAFVADDGTPVVDVVFLCRLLADDPVRAAPDEVGAFRWMTAAEVAADPAAPPWTRRSIALAERRRAELGW